MWQGIGVFGGSHLVRCGKHRVASLQDGNGCILLDTNCDEQKKDACLDKVHADKFLHHVRVCDHDEKPPEKQHDKDDEVGSLKGRFDKLNHEIPRR